MRINDKIREIEKYLKELNEIKPETLSEYKELKTKAACERYFEKIIEAVIDLAFLTIKELGLKIPEEDKKAFDILAERSIISKELSQKLKEAKGMRNIISHEYGIIEDKVVFESITEQLEEDVSEFLESIETHIKKTA
ncbi:DUF86 domain-containing protein [Candidatus Woesearchaeota archaeon]|nr:DUF86 domain-containing protein [Candidatus Woesearchaeota archaeon]